MDLHALAAAHFDLLLTDVLPLPGEVDRNYRLTTNDGTRYALKISRPGADLNAITFQYNLLAHLAEKDLPFATPRPVGGVVKLPTGEFARLLTWVPGRLLDEVRPRTKALRKQWGRVAGHLTNALADLTHLGAPRAFKWNPSQTLDARPGFDHPLFSRKLIAEDLWAVFERDALPYLADLPMAVNFNDAHEHNLLVGDNGQISGVIDFGDAMYTQRVNELSIACAYAGMHVPDPLGAMAEVAGGYGEVARLTDAEIGMLFPLITGRLLITVAEAAKNAVREPDNEYLQVSAEPAWALLEKLYAISPIFAWARFGTALGRKNPLGGLRLRNLHPVVPMHDESVGVLDLSVGSQLLGNYENYEKPAAFNRLIRRHLEDEGVDFGVGGYGEIRPVYTTDDFATEGNYGPRWRTTHLGTDVWAPVGTEVFAPLDGIVKNAGVDATAHGYGNFLILEHQDLEGRPFFTLYGHLSADSTNYLAAGTRVQRGSKIASFGHPDENGGWPPHLHFQVILDLVGYESDFPGVAYPDEAAAWLALCPDPTPFLGLSDILNAGLSDARERKSDPSALLARRKTSLGYSLSLSYQKPLLIERGIRQYLIDHTGRRYLDTVNNVAHVGHEHPDVVRAIRRQAAVVNTNSRYLHENVVHLAEELTNLLPPALSVVHFTNSGSEANELALRMCEQHAGTRNMLAVEAGYHGNTGRTIDVSGYKFDGKGGKGCPPQTRIIPLPDVFRGLHRDPAAAGKEYADYARERIGEWTSEGEKVGGFIAESILSCGGQIVLPEGYLAEVYRHVRAAGGLCIADEVQVGLGRVGEHFWGFELQGVVPDIVTIGKPLGNGHPIGAVVCTPEVAASFANGMEYFNTFGGNPVSCAAGLAVIDVVRRDGLLDHALDVGNYLLELLRDLKLRHPIIGDVRGRGLFLGFELAVPSSAPASPPQYVPATRQAAYLKNRMRDLGFLMSTDGPDENVIKIKPPMCFTRENAELLVRYLDEELGGFLDR